MSNIKLWNSVSMAKGAYVLQIRLKEDLQLDLASLKYPLLETGLYLYCGSANGPGGIRARVKRHVKRDKKPHWHVDRLTIAYGVEAFCTFEGGCECDLVAHLLKQKFTHIPLIGLGSSDCKSCRAHLVEIPADMSLADCGFTAPVVRPVRRKVF